MTDRHNRPRRPDEDVVDWAVETGRFEASRAIRYRRHLADGTMTEDMIEAMASGMTTPSPSKVQASGPRSASHHVRAASPPADPAGEALVNAEMYREASAVSPPPELFPGGGDLPLATASGIEPRALAGVAWWLRPAIAEASTLPEAVELLQMASTSDGAVAAGADKRFTNSDGLQDFMGRVKSWAMAGSAAAGARAWEAEYDDRARAIAASRPVEEWSDDELYDRLFGAADRHHASLAEVQRRHVDARAGRKTQR